jgi:protein TonB
VGFKSLIGKERNGGALLPALAVSIVLHALLLGSAPPRSEARAGSHALAATLRAAPAAVVAQAAAVGATAKVSPARTAAAPVARRTAPAQATVSPAPPTVAGDGAGNSPAQPAPQAVLAAAASGGAGLADAIDANGLRSYRIGLAREARSHRSYPPLARERGWSGTAEIEVDVPREGAPRQVVLARSSGHDILDRAALAMMSRAAAAAALPDSLRGQAFAVRLPVVFDLAEAQRQ